MTEFPLTRGKSAKQNKSCTFKKSQWHLGRLKTLTLCVCRSQKLDAEASACVWMISRVKLSLVLLLHNNTSCSELKGNPVCQSAASLSFQLWPSWPPVFRRVLMQGCDSLPAVGFSPTYLSLFTTWVTVKKHEPCCSFCVSFCWKTTTSSDFLTEAQKLSVQSEVLQTFY